MPGLQQLDHGPRVLLDQQVELARPAEPMKPPRDLRYDRYGWDLRAQRDKGQRSSMPKYSAMRWLYSSSERSAPMAIQVSSLMRERPVAKPAASVPTVHRSR